MNLTPDQLKLYKQLETEEGKRGKPYKDTVGKLTIGIGRNLTDVGLSDDEIMYLWRNDVIRSESALDAQLPWWRSLDLVRQRVLLDMCFNMGIGVLLQFRNTLAAIKSGNYSAAARGMLNSLWARQVGDRAKVLADMMETGNDPYSG